MTARSMVSIIIPVYNKGKYLATCLDSALEQSYQNIEIICVNDGSTDSSAGILDDYSSKYSTVKIHQFPNNRGHGVARNKGLELALGEFLFCLDADDSVPVDAIENLYSAARQTDSDLVVGHMKWLRHKSRETTEPTKASNSKELVTTTAQESEYLQSVPGCHCCNLYRRQFLLDQDIRYATDLTLGADQLFQATAIVKAKRVALINDVVYFYHHYRADSLTLKKPSLDNLLDDIEYQRRMAFVFIESGLAQAGRQLLQRWSYSIREYWIKIPGSLTPDDASQMFSAFRNIVREFGVTPWISTSPDHHRHLLKLVLAGKDRQAFEFLGSEQTRTDRLRA